MSTEFASLGERDFLITEDYSNTIEHIWFRPFELLDGSKRRIAAPLFMVKRRGDALDGFTRSRDTLQDPLASDVEAVSGIRLLPTPPLNVFESTNLEE